MEELNFYFKQINRVITEAQSLKDKPHINLVSKFRRWMFDPYIKELKYQLDTILKMNNIEKSKSYSIHEYEELIAELGKTSRGKSVIQMLFRHTLCIDDFVSKNVCKEAFKDKKIIDSRLIREEGDSIDLIKEKLLSISGHNERLIYTNILAKELDAKLCVTFDQITELEKEGYESLFIRRDINDFLRGVISVFNDFQIDILSCLKNYKDFDPQYGCYDDYKNEIESELSKEETPILKFRDFLLHKEKDSLMLVLHSLMDGQDCKTATKVLIALEEIGFLHKPSNAKLHRALLEEFNLRFTASAMNSFFRERNIKYSKREIDSIVKTLLDIK